MDINQHYSNAPGMHEHAGEHDIIAALANSQFRDDLDFPGEAPVVPHGERSMPNSGKFNMPEPDKVREMTMQDWMDKAGRCSKKVSNGAFTSDGPQAEPMQRIPYGHLEGIESSYTSGYYFLQGAEQADTSPKSFTHEARVDEEKSQRDWSEYREFHPNSIRLDFPVLHQTVHGKPLVWLDNGATTQKPFAVINAIKRFYENDNSNIHRGAHTLAARATDAFEDAREKVRRFIGAGSKEEIIFVRGTTEGVNLLANTFGKQVIHAGDEIILSEVEHHANIVPWQMLAKERGAHLRVVPINSDGDIMLEEYERLFSPKTKLVALTHVSNALGTVLPVAQMINTAHRYGVPVVIDGAQSIQHMPVNVQELDADFFVFSGHKLFAPTGVGVVYGKAALLEKMPPWQGGGNMIDRVTFEETTYNGVPAKFEAGTPNVADVIGLGAAIDYLQKIGMDTIQRYEHELMHYMLQELKRVPGIQIIGNPKERAGALSFVLPPHSTTAIGQFLDREGIALRSGHHCAQPALRHFGLESSVRPSIAL